MRTLLYQLYQLLEACFLRNSTASVCNQKLSPHEVDQNSIQTKNKSTNKVKQKVVVGVFRHGKSKSGLSNGLALLLRGIMATCCPNS